MLKKKVARGIDIHSLVTVANVLRQTDVWDGIADYNIHQSAFDKALSVLSQMCSVTVCSVWPPVLATKRQRVSEGLAVGVKSGAACKGHAGVLAAGKAMQEC